ncbi:hypothetical protein VTH06DRAFT_414 [Thermothelomyces fergusii]
MATAASGRQAWRQLLRNTPRWSASSLSRPQQQQQQQYYRLVFGRQLSSGTRTASGRATARSPSSLSFFRGQQPPAQRPYSSGSQGKNTPPRNDQQIKFWPFLVVIALGSGGYVLLVNKRKKMSSADTSGTTPAFSPADVTVLFVLGGPGAGKGTQCARLVRDFHFKHLSAGDLLRAEQDRPGSQYGQLIRDCIKNGEIVPMEVTVALLEKAMRETMATTGTRKFLIDGFPRKMDQAVKFEEVVCPARLVLFYDCPEAEMERRLLERGKTSGRADDNAESIRKRFRTFVETSMPVVDAFDREGRVIKVDATATPDEVYAATKEKLKRALGDKF